MTSLSKYLRIYKIHSRYFFFSKNFFLRLTQKNHRFVQKQQKVVQDDVVFDVMTLLTKLLQLENIKVETSSVSTFRFVAH